jgi:L-iditol 2-dehydrogenase
MRQIEMPVPAAGELLLRVDAATTCGTDLKVWRHGGHPRMLVVPTPFGHEVAGTVAAVGEGVGSRRVGDRVMVANSAACGTCRACSRGQQNLCRDLAYLNGAFAEYLLVPARFVARSTYPLPATLAATRAALAEPLACVLHGIETCHLEGRGDALILGGGPIGLLFVAALTADGHRVVLADPHPDRLAAGRDLGAAETVRIADRDAGAATARELAEDPLGFDLTVDATGAVSGWQAVVEAVRPGGTVSLFGGCPPGTTLLLDTHWVHYSELTLVGAYHHRPATVERALVLLADQRFAADRLISVRVPLEETEEALRRMGRREVLKAAVLPHGDES